MLTLILLAAIVIGLIIWTCKSYWDAHEVAFYLTIIFSGVFIIVCLTLCNRGKRFDLVKEEYGNLKMQVEEYNSLPDSCKLVTFEYDIRKGVLSMNDKISRHKVMSKSIWRGLWFSEEIGRLDKLHIIGKADTRESEQPTAKK